MLTDLFHPRAGGGVEEAVLSVSRRLVAAGDEVHVLALDTEHAGPRDTLDGIQVHRARMLDFTNRLGMQFAVSAEALPMAIRLARELRPDIVHTHNLLFSITAIAPVIRAIVRRPLVTTIQVGALDHLRGVSRIAAGAWERCVARPVLRSSDAVIAVSHAVADYAGRLGCLSEVSCNTGTVGTIA